MGRLAVGGNAVINGGYAVGPSLFEPEIRCDAAPAGEFDYLNFE